MDYIIVEQTRKYKNRVVYDPAQNRFYESDRKCLFFERGFIYPYGWLEGTGTPPDEHLDIFLLSEQNCRLGDRIPVKIVGVFIRNDGDHKLISIAPERPENDFFELPDNEKNALFKLYSKAKEGDGWFGFETAKKVIAKFAISGRAGM